MLRLARSDHDWSSLGRIILTSSQFISVKHPAMGATIHIDHWLKDTMKAVGIDIDAFSVHLLEIPPPSGVPMSGILKVAS